MKKLKILLAALLVIGSTAKAQVVYGENEKEYIKASSFSNGRTEKERQQAIPFRTREI